MPEPFAKTCFKCGVEQPIACFYKHPSMKYGVLNKCKSCARADVRAARRANVEYYRAYDRVRYYNNGYRGEATSESKSKSSKAWALRNKEKKKAHSVVSSAIASGAIIRPNKCSECSSETPVQAHHPDYAEPLRVEWLCLRCHNGRHCKNDYDHDVEIVTIGPRHVL